ncbi:GIY-YIG nuclease family protein [Xanthobacter sp. V4C-4]|uniref:GIY-YIG nuclease family protein n=1 Tax=Xanthobacter cornucopiae TaxID=3119924 RepID=UPI003728DD84
MATPFTIRIFVPDGDPEGLRIIDRMNWTGLGIAFPREQWPRVKQRAEFSRPGVYILVGYAGDDDLPMMYIGQGDGVRNRIDAHFVAKDFWHWGIAFVSHSAGGGLNRAHITWLEYALIERAIKARRSRLDNGNAPL